MLIDYQHFSDAFCLCEINIQTLIHGEIWNSCLMKERLKQINMLEFLKLIE